MSRLLLLGVGGPMLVASRADGNYYYGSTSVVPPLPLGVEWVANTVADDGVSPDHTTGIGFTKDTASTPFVHFMYYKAAGASFNSFVASVENKGLLDGQAWYSANGSAWAVWDNTLTLPDNLGVATFTDYARNPTDRVAVAVCITFRDTVGASGTPPCSVNVTEFIPTFV
jgi:hypothetical protein